jgi:Arc/MetJ-type ribon-helix-helix transcriptional regulator
MKQTMPFSLDDNRDRDILDWLNSQTNRSAVIREALRAAMQRQAKSHDTHHDNTLTDIYRLVLEINSRLESGVFVASPGATQDEPQEASEALDSLAMLALS